MGKNPGTAKKSTTIIFLRDLYVFCTYSQIFWSGNHILKVKSGYLWIIIVHMNYTSEVNEVAVKTGTLPSGNTVNCKLMDVEARLLGKVLREFWMMLDFFVC